MPPDLPLYSKSALDGLGESEGLLRHQDNGEDSSLPTTYPPEASTSASTTASASDAVKQWGLPAHLANYKLDGAFMLWTDKTAICGRSKARLETIDNLLTVFPVLAGRDPNTIQFKVACPPPAGSNQTGPSWSRVPDCLHEEVIVQGKPDNILVVVDVTKSEYKKQWIRGVLAFGSPLWLFAIVFLIMFLCGVK